MNAAGFTHVDRKWRRKSDAAFAVNAYAVRDLASLCKRIRIARWFTSARTTSLGARRGSQGRRTVRPTNPAPGSTVRGRQQAGQGVRLRPRLECPRHFILRTCGLYGVHMEQAAGAATSVEAILQQAQAGAALHAVVCDQVCTPTSVADFARRSWPNCCTRKRTARITSRTTGNAVGMNLRKQWLN